MNQPVDVLLVVPPCERLFDYDSTYYPLGICYISAFLKKHGISSSIVYLDIFKKTIAWRIESLFFREMRKISRKIRKYGELANDPDADLWKEIWVAMDEFHPKIIGITSTTFTIPSVTNVARSIKQKNSDVKVVVGGPAATTSPKIVAGIPFVDFIVEGEGERKMLNICRSILAKGSRIDEEMITNLDSLPFPERDAVFTVENGKVKQCQFYLNIASSRGCPHKCKFCANRVTWGAKYRLRSVKNVVDEIEYNVTHKGVRDFHFVDDLFTITKKRVLEFCAELHARNLKITWRAYACINTIDREMLEAMKAAGCYYLSFGVESGNDRVLRHMNKSQTVALIKEKAAIINEVGIQWLCLAIKGIPTETIEEMNDTLRLIHEIKPTRAFISTFTPYPGSEFFDEIVAAGRMKDAMLNDQRAIDNNYTGTMSDHDFRKAADRITRFFDCYNYIHEPVTLHRTGHILRDWASFLVRWPIFFVIGIVSRIEMRYVHGFKR